MLSSFLLHRVSTASIRSAAPAVTIFPSNGNFWKRSQDGTPHPHQQQQQQQVRWITKKRQHRQAKHKHKEELASKGVFPPKPHMYIPRDTPVINAVSRDERDADSKRQDEIAAKELKAKLDIVKEPLLRFGFNGENLVMSDRVRKLFDLHNGNQSEVVKAQKQRGMELFQLREADTGSSAVQGE
jgi:hypothetical protein